MPTYIDVHILQNVPPSNLNRDDSGSPKQAVYGGARRARVSSQAWKRATRTWFAANEPEIDHSTRTTRIATVLADRLAAAAPQIDAATALRLSSNLLKPLGITPGKKDNKTAYLLFFGVDQLDPIVATVAPRAEELAALSDKDLAHALGELSIEGALATGHPLDVALFGRMVADLPTLNVDAATQVAHAISTHAAEIEFDYFTALDDEQRPSDNEGAGAAMIGTVEFNSATLYRFATVGVEQLAENLGGDVEATVDGVVRFVEAFAKSMPTGKQNTFGNRTLPDMVLVAVRDDQPVNLVSAFEDPVWSRSGYLAESTRRLVAELTDVAAHWGHAPVLTAVSARAKLTEELGDLAADNSGFDELLVAVRSTVEGQLTAGVIR